MYSMVVRCELCYDALTQPHDVKGIKDFNYMHKFC